LFSRLLPTQLFQGLKNEKATVLPRRCSTERCGSVSVQFNHLALDARENGFGNEDKWVLVGELKGLDDRNSQCIISMLETPRPALRNREEEKMWNRRLKKLIVSAINLPSTVARK
jgi:hypothetical protein